jgi:hypothetical protein
LPVLLAPWKGTAKTPFQREEHQYRSKKLH